MNTIEQAREVAERLRNHDTCISDKKAADTIDALITALNDERMRCAQADNAVAQMAEELAALKAQEPVGEAVKNYGCGGSTFVRFSRELGIGEKVYLAAGAQPVQQEPITSSEKTWCQYVAGMIGTYLGEPIESERCKAIAGIIERRLWALGGVAPVKNQEPDDLTIAYMSGFYEGKKAAAQPVQQEPAATVAEVHMSRYTLEWTDGPLAEGTKLYAAPVQAQEQPKPPTALSSK